MMERYSRAVVDAWVTQLLIGALDSTVIAWGI